MKELTTVILDTNGSVCAFPLEQAQKILDYQFQRGLNHWELNDPKFQIVDGIIKRANIRTAKEAKESEGS